VLPLLALLSTLLSSQLALLLVLGSRILASTISASSGFRPVLDSSRAELGLELVDRHLVEVYGE